MKKIFILFLPILFFVGPVIAQEATEESEEVVTLIEEPGEGVVTGEVISLDAASGTISVKIDDVEKTFSVIDGETILWKGIEDIELSDINTGDEAEVGYYTDDEGKLVASWVDVLIEEGVVPVGVEEETEEKGSPKGSPEEKGSPEGS